MSNSPSHHPEIIFSLEGGMVWVSWSHTNAKVELGKYDIVIEMMSDFLKQCEVAERLIDASQSGG